MPIVVISTQEYFALTSAERQRQFEDLALKHSSISPLLIKLEGTVMKTSTGEHPDMCAYYNYWEQRIFDLLYQVSEKISVKLLSIFNRNPALFCGLSNDDDFDQSHCFLFEPKLKWSE